MALSPFKGTIIKKSNLIYLKTTSQIYEVNSSDPDIQASFLKFKDGDEVSGLADLVKNTLVFQTIDYIGLKQLLGSWRAESLYLIIPNFNEMNFFNFLIQGYPRYNTMAQLAQKYIYSVHPSADEGFNLFLSDSETTLSAEIQIKGKSLRLTIFDAGTGDVLHKYNLIKL